MEHVVLFVIVFSTDEGDRDFQMFLLDR